MGRVRGTEESEEADIETGSVFSLSKIKRIFRSYPPGEVHLFKKDRVA